VRPARFCVNCHGDDCGLDREPCLFFHLNDPCWTVIRASIRYRSAGGALRQP
jgi:hypothetical protein